MTNPEKVEGASKFDRAMKEPLMHTTENVSEMEFPCVRPEWREILRGACLTPRQIGQLIERILAAKSISQKELASLRGNTRANVSNMLRNPERRVESLKEVLSRLTGLECTETRYRVE
jgi:predicted XRE-type DNA-binding protein